VFWPPYYDWNISNPIALTNVQFADDRAPAVLIGI